jgi:hypothetical protein
LRLICHSSHCSILYVPIDLRSLPRRWPVLGLQAIQSTHSQNCRLPGTPRRALRFAICCSNSPVPTIPCISVRRNSPASSRHKRPERVAPLAILLARKLSMFVPSPADRLAGRETIEKVLPMLFTQHLLNALNQTIGDNFGTNFELAVSNGLLNCVNFCRIKFFGQ